MGTSAGGINSLLLADAFGRASSPEEAADSADMNLKRFWRNVANTGWGLYTLESYNSLQKMLFPILQGDFSTYPNLSDDLSQNLDDFIRFTLPRGKMGEMITNVNLYHCIHSLDAVRNSSVTSFIHYCDGETTTYDRQELQQWENRIVTGSDIQWDDIRKSVSLICTDGYSDRKGRIGFDGAYLQNGLATPLLDMEGIDTVIYIGLNGYRNPSKLREPVESVEKKGFTDRDIAESLAKGPCNFNWVMAQIPEKRRPEVINVSLQGEKDWNTTARKNTNPLLITDLTHRGDTDMREALGLEKSSVGGWRLVYA